MSSFNCDVCGLPIIESENGEYITGCSHYPLEKLSKYNKNYVTATLFKFPTFVIRKDISVIK